MGRGRNICEHIFRVLYGRLKFTLKRRRRFQLFEVTTKIISFKGMDHIDSKKFKLTCSICKEKKAGVCINCAKEKCSSTFHIECARRANFYMETKNQEKVNPINNLLFNIRGALSYFVKGIFR